MDTNIQDLKKDSHQDFDELLKIVLPFAKGMLIKHGSFHPFGAYKEVDGNISAIAGYDERQEGNLQDSIDLLLDGLRREAKIDRIKAAAVCTTVNVQLPHYTDEVSAIHVNLDHAEGEAIDVYLPYKENTGGEIRFEDACAVESVSIIFSSSQ